LCAFCTLKPVRVVHLFRVIYAEREMKTPNPAPPKTDRQEVAGEDEEEEKVGGRLRLQHSAPVGPELVVNHRLVVLILVILGGSG